MDWVRFAFGYQIPTESLAPHLVQIEAYKEAALNLVLPPKWSKQLERPDRVRAAHGTTALEGKPLSEAEVELQIGRLPQASALPSRLPREHAQVRNASLAQDWVKGRFQPRAAPIRSEDILHMHRLITAHSDEENNVPGEFRKHPVVVGTEGLGGVHRGAPAPCLHELMEGFIAFVNSRRHREGVRPVVRALAAHCFLVTIHPFGDSNGRVSRLVEAGLPFAGGTTSWVSMVCQTTSIGTRMTTSAFFSGAVQHSPSTCGSLCFFGLEGFAEELQGINKFIKTKLNRLVYRDMPVRTLGSVRESGALCSTSGSMIFLTSLCGRRSRWILSRQSPQG